METQLLKRARKKYLSSRLAAELVELKSSLHVGYRNTLACSHQLEVTESSELKSTFYCRRRWCSTCASINMATLIDRYRPAVEVMISPQFVTLTIPNCRSDEIEIMMERMRKTWRAITDLSRKSHIQLSGIRKTELKVGKGGGFHPHFHIIVDGEKEARWIVNQWLERWPTASPLAQDVRKVNQTEQALVELMKYATKVTCSENAGNQTLCTARQMDRIFRATHGKRLIQPFGKVKAVPENSFDPEPQIVEKARGLYQWVEHDWYHQETGEALTGFKPGDIAQMWKDDARQKPSGRTRPQSRPRTVRPGPLTGR